jgi:hypothetical protein
MAGDYADGVWRWDTSAGWAHISTQQATKLTVDNAGDVYGKFSDGLWRWDAGTSGWQKLSALPATDFQVTGGGVLYGDFGAAGVWRWSFAGWQKLSDQDVVSFKVSDSDAFFGSFNTGSFGTWRWTPTAGWSLLTSSRPDQLATDAAGDFVGVYNLEAPPSAHGTWRWNPTTGWARLSTDVTTIAVSADGVIYEARNAAGLWRLDPNQSGATFTQVSMDDMSSSTFVALPDGGLFLDFYVTGAAAFTGWVYNGTGWAKVIDNLDNTMNMVGGQDHDEVFFNDGAGGTWHWNSQTPYQQLSSMSSTVLASRTIET